MEILQRNGLCIMVIRYQEDGEVVEVFSRL